MKFLPAPDDLNNNLFERQVSENGLIEIGIYPTIYGYRVRAGFVGQMSVVIDYCGGDRQKYLNLLYSATIAILSLREENKQAFDGMPDNSTIKPYFNDPTFFSWLIKAAGGNGSIKLIELPALESIRARMNSNLPVDVLLKLESLRKQMQ